MTRTANPALDQLRRLADELELKIHLAGMEARSRWKDLQPRLAEIEHTVERETEHAADFVSEQLKALAKALTDLRDDVERKVNPRPS